jgi:hypothetical protein
MLSANLDDPGHVAVTEFCKFIGAPREKFLEP